MVLNAGNYIFENAFYSRKKYIVQFSDKGFIVFVHPIFFNKYITAPYLRQKEEDYGFILLSFVKHILNARSDIFEMHFRGGSL